MPLTCVFFVVAQGLSVSVFWSRQVGSIPSIGTRDGRGRATYAVFWSFVDMDFVAHYRRVPTELIQEDWSLCKHDY